MQLMLPFCLRLACTIVLHRSVTWAALERLCLFCFSAGEEDGVDQAPPGLLECRLFWTPCSAGCTIARSSSNLSPTMLACAGPQIIESDGSEEAAEAVENLLESYFIQIDSTYDRLVSIGKADIKFQAKLALSASLSCLQMHICSLKLPLESPAYCLIGGLPCS